MTFDPLYHERACAELSRTGRWLALTDHDTADHNVPARTWIADLERGTLRRVTLPDTAGMRSGTSGFAFSPDERSLAIELVEGMWIGYPVEDTVPSGRVVRGDHQHSRRLLPIGYTADGRRLVALGQQLTVATYDAASGELVGRVMAPSGHHDGVLRVSADGSRAVVYRYLADILVVVDGGTGTLAGYLCPYFCNRFHNPVDVPFAVSPDGRRVATGGRLGAGLWDTDADTLVAPLVDRSRPPLRPR
jgi:hypothetical protein